MQMHIQPQLPIHPNANTQTLKRKKNLYSKPIRV